MASNRTVTYLDIGLNSVDEYWNALVIAGVKAFRSEASSRTVFHAAHAVWHLHDWVWHDRNPGQDSRGNAFFAYRASLIAACPELGWLSDVADAGKHRGLGRLAKVAGAQPHVVMRPQVIGDDGVVTGGVLKYFLVLSDESHQDFEAVLRAATNFWLAELSPKQLDSPFA